MINLTARKNENLLDAFNLLQTHMIMLSDAEKKEKTAHHVTASNILPRAIMMLIGLQISAIELEPLKQLSALVTFMQQPAHFFNTETLININRTLTDAMSISWDELNTILHIYNIAFTRITELIGNRKEEFLREAAKAGNALTVAQLLRIDGIHVNSQSKSGTTTLMCAAGNGHTSIVTALLHVMDIAVNAIDTNGDTALILAARYGHSSVVTALLNVDGILVNAKNNDGYTALMSAAYYGKASVVTQLLDAKDIAVNAESNNGWTALMCAVYNGHTSVVTQLVNTKDIAVNAIDNAGMTALMCAANKGRTSIVYQLCVKHLFDAPYGQGNEFFQQLTNEIKSASNQIDINPASLYANLLICVEALPTADKKITLLKNALSKTNAFSALMKNEQRLQIEEALKKLNSPQEAQSTNSTQPVIFSAAPVASSSSSNTAHTSPGLISNQ